MSNWFQEIIANPVASISIVVNLVLLEALLSVDNAAVLATMVKKLPEADQKKALRYGIIGAYLFRGLSIIFASQIMKIWYLKTLGGLYLLYLGIQHFFKKDTHEQNDTAITSKWELKGFWPTVAAIELMDMAFSIDNIFAAVAFTDNIGLIIFGVFIGILAIRFVAQYFVNLLKLYPVLEKISFGIIFMLGLKLILGSFNYTGTRFEFLNWINSHEADWIVSITTLILFFLPILLLKKRKKD